METNNPENKSQYTELVEKVTSTTISNDQLSNNLDDERKDVSERKGILLDGLKEFYNMRKIWSVMLMLALILVMSFNILLVICVGLQWLTFDDEWFLRLVLTTNLADVIGLIYIVVSFLFKTPPDDLP